MAALPRPLLLPRLPTRHVSTAPLPRLLLRRPLPRPAAAVSGGAEESTSTRCRETSFSALAAVLRRIEPLDTSALTAVPAAARDSMKRTISTMLGLLPSEQFHVYVTVSNIPLRKLLVSSIITGYTLWNAEYRVGLMRRFERSGGEAEREVVEEEVDGRGDWDGDVGCSVEMMGGERVGELAAAAERYVRDLEAQLAAAEKELDDQKHEYTHLEENKEEDTDLLKYLRSLEPVRVCELSQPSSPEVQEIIQQLVQGIHLRYFNDDPPNFLQDLDNRESGDREKEVNGHDVTVVTTRDYLAKLLFWCMLLGHHLRGLEHRLHLSCCVGLL